MSDSIRVLIIEDSDGDAALLEGELQRAGLRPNCERVNRADTFRNALETHDWDVVLSDTSVPGFGADDALTVLNKDGYSVPLIVVSGDTRTADVVSLLQAGARDFVEKDDLGRLAPAIERTLRTGEERKALLRAQEAARASEERYRRLVELSPDGVMVHTDGVISFANAAMAKILGAISADDLLGRVALDFVPDQDRDTVLARRLQAADSETLKYRETQYQKLDGGLVDVERAIALISWQERPSFLVVARDITERRQAADALHESTAMLRGITDGVPAMISYVDREERLGFINRQYAEWFDRRPEDVVGEKVFELIGQDAYERTDPYRRKALAGEEVTFEGEKAVKGETRHHRATFMPHRDATGEVQGYFVMLLDTTGQKHMEEALRESENRFRAFFDNSPASMYVTDREGRFVLVNKEFRRRFNFTEDEIVGKFGRDIQPPKIADLYTKMNEVVLRENRTTTQIVDQVYPDGTPRSNLSIKFPIRDGAGEPIGVGSVNTDISDIQHAQRALRDSEIKFRGLVEGSLQGILIHVEGIPKYINAEYARTFGYTPEEFMQLPSVFRLLHPDDFERVTALVSDRESGKMDTSLYEFRGIHKSGKELSLYAKGSLIEWDGKPANYIAVIDVTEQKRMEAQLQQSQKMEAVGQLTGGIAHDFNNLLTVVLGNLQLADSTAASGAPVAPFLETAIRAVRRGAELTQRLLAFSRRQSLAPSASDVNDLIGGMKTLLERSLGAQIEIVINLDPALRPAMIDSAQLENALLNIALNARDAMPNGGKLTVETRNVALDAESAKGLPDVVPGDYVTLTVSDTGAGMPSEVLRQAFEPFFTTKETGKGTGLGLSMVYGFARQSDGHAEIESRPGQGTSVRIYMPAADSPAVEETPADDAAEPGTGHETVLVVEDDPDVLSLVTGMLQELGYLVLEAEDGPRGLAILEREQPIDLLLTDVILPGGMNGRMVAENARKLRPDIRVLYTSGYAEDVLSSEGRLEDGISFLPKPYTFDSLGQAVRLALEARP